MPLRVDYNILNQKGTPAFYSDIFANRPAAGFAGRVFISTDTGAIYEDTGTAWTLIADAGAGTTGTLQQVTTNGNTTTQGISITAGGLSANSLTDTALTTGSVLFSGAGGLLSESNATLFWDNTNKRLGIGNAAPGTKLDVHGTGTIATFNGTTTNDGFIAFQNAGTTKWTIGNQYAGGVNNFQIKNSAGTAIYSITGSTQSNFSTNTVVSGVFTANNVGDQIRVSGGAIDASIHTYAGNNLMYIGDTTTGTKGINIDLSTGNTTNSGSISAGGTFICTAGNNSTFLSSYYATTGYSFAGVANTGANLRFGIEGSSGSQLFTGSSAYASVIGTQNATVLQLGTNANIYATITATGFFGIGTPSPSCKFNVVTNQASNYAAIFNNNTSDPYGIWSYFSGAAPASNINEFFVGSDNVNTRIFIYSNGSIYNRTGTYGTISDKLLKENIVDATPKLNDILKLKVRNFNFINEEQKQLGFIAQEFEEVFPKMVDLSKDRIINKQFKAIKTSVLVPMHTKAIQELHSLIQEINDKLQRNNIN